MKVFPGCLALVLLGWLPILHAGNKQIKPVTAMRAHTTCAVYFRMIAGSIEANAGDDSALAYLPKGKMSALADAARSDAVKAYGSEHAEARFDVAWRSILADMTDQINRNYRNITRLRVRYEDGCEAMYKSLNQGSP